MVGRVKAFLQADIVGADATIEQVRRQSNNFAVTSPSTPADRSEQRRTVTNTYSQVAGTHEFKCEPSRTGIQSPSKRKVVSSILTGAPPTTNSGSTRYPSQAGQTDCQRAATMFDGPLVQCRARTAVCVSRWPSPHNFRNKSLSVSGWYVAPGIVDHDTLHYNFQAGHAAYNLVRS
jgi:hypothetical protein